MLSSFTCEPGEEITATLALPGTDEHPSPSSICIGTVEFQVGEREPSAGRIILFSLEPNAGTKPTRKMLVSHDVGGCVYQLANVEGMIAAAVNTSVRGSNIALVALLNVPVAGDALQDGNSERDDPSVEQGIGVEP